MRQGFVAVIVASLTSLMAGLTLAGMDGRIADIEGLFVLIPVSIGMRGNIFGALAARLGTSIHSGLFEVSNDRNGILFQNVYAATLLTIGTSVTMGMLGESDRRPAERRHGLGLGLHRRGAGRRDPVLGRRPGGDHRPLDPVVPPRLGPRLGRRAADHRDRRRRHAPLPSPRVLRARDRRPRPPIIGGLALIAAVVAIGPRVDDEQLDRAPHRSRELPDPVHRHRPRRPRRHRRRAADGRGLPAVPGAPDHHPGLPREHRSARLHPRGAPRLEAAPGCRDAERETRAGRAPRRNDRARPGSDRLRDHRGRHLAAWPR